MERAHVLVRLQNETSVSSAVGICRTSSTTVRLEHSEMSPGVASITFEQVFDVNDSNVHVFETSLTGAIDSVIDGKDATLISAGTASSSKSFACHDKLSNGKVEPGLITLAIRQLFSNLEAKSTEGWKYNVLLSCWGIGRSEASNNEMLMDLLTPETIIDMNVIDKMEELLVERAVVVSTQVEAIEVYAKALECVNDAENRDFTVAFHVETLLPSGVARRGRFLVVDVHGMSVIESRGTEWTKQSQPTEEHFLDTQFPVNEVLSASFGSFVGHTSSTYLLVTIQTPAQFQQRAIQSLLYACKAKEIKSSSSINYLSAFEAKSSSSEPSRAQMRAVKKAGNQIASFSEDNVAPGALSYPTFPTNSPVAPLFTIPPSYVSPSLSTMSSDSTCELVYPAHSSQHEESENESASLSPSTSCASGDSQRQSTVSMRVRKAYELAKAATSSTKTTNTAFESAPSEDAAVHAIADELLKHVSRDTLQHLTLQAKLEQIHTTQLELERALAHEMSVKDKCIDRISRLHQTMSCQVVEHEQQLHDALTAKHAAEAELQNLRIKFSDAEREVAGLQEQIQALKASQRVTCANDDAQSSENDRTMLHTLSMRLEEAMVQAKDVITFKDGVIQSLEKRLQLASKRGADAVTLLKEESGRFECDKAQLVLQLQQSKEKSTNNKSKSEEVTRLQAENVAAQQQKADLAIKVAQLTVELETARSQWAQEAHDREQRAEERCAEQVSQAEEQLDQVATAMQHQMAQFREELDVRMTRQRVATQVACKASELKYEELERELQHTKQKLTKRKIKMEKKARALVANTHKQYKKPVALLERKLKEQAACIDIMLEREQDTSSRAKESEEIVKELRTEILQLQTSMTALEQERKALTILCKELKSDRDTHKGELERRVREMEESTAQQIIAAEARVHHERDVQVQKLVDQHDHEISRLKTATREQEALTSTLVRLERRKSSSSMSSRVSSTGDESLVSDSSRQRSIDELDALIDSKERRDKRAEHQRKGDNSPRSSSSASPTKTTLYLRRALAHKEEEITELAARQKQLLTALATANEQETLAKQQAQDMEMQYQRELARYEELLGQLNGVKQENWNLSLALHVTEATSHQQLKQAS